MPGGAFERAWEAVTRYEFSDPAIVTGHFDPSDDLEGRTMLLELKSMGFRFLAGTRVGATRSETREHETVLGYRYDTLEGHIERGAEWFLLSKAHATGEIRYEISARWRPGTGASVHVVRACPSTSDRPPVHLRVRSSARRVADG